MKAATAVSFSFLSADESAAMGNPSAFLSSLVTDDTAHRLAGLAISARWCLLARQTRADFEVTVAAVALMNDETKAACYKRLHEACKEANSPYTIKSRKALSELFVADRVQDRILSEDEKAEAQAASEKAEADRVATANKAEAVKLAAIRDPLEKLIAEQAATIAEQAATILELRSALAIASAELIARASVATDAPRGHAKRAASVAAVA